MESSRWEEMTESLTKKTRQHCRTFPPKKEVAVLIKVDITSHGSPEFTGRDTFRIQETVELIMTPLFRMICEVSLCEVLKTC